MHTKTMFYSPQLANLSGLLDFVFNSFQLG